MGYLVGVLKMTIATREQVENAILELVDGQHDLFPFEFGCPSDINKGVCEDFAMAVLAFLNHPENLTLACATDLLQPDLYGHVWLELATPEGIIYFDSEIEYGVEHPEDLPFYLNQ